MVAALLIIATWQMISLTKLKHNVIANITASPNVSLCVCNLNPLSPSGPPTVEAVMTLLMGVAGRWKAIALGLGFNKDHIEDEIDLNNSTDEACLQNCVEQWVARLQPSWEKLSHVLRDMGEDGLAQKAWNGGIAT